MNYSTEGEKMLQRPLAKEMRAGVEHYQPGQHYAEIVQEDTHYYAVLSYVTHMGDAVQYLCRKKNDGNWEPYGETLTRAGVGVSWGALPMPQGVNLSALMVRALEEARMRWEEEQSVG